MAVTRIQKEALLKELTEKCESAESIIFAHYIGLNVADVSALRKELKKANAEMKVAKKTLFQLAAKNTGLPEVADEALNGPVSLIFSFADPLSGAQVAFKFAKDHNQVALIGGIFDGKLLTAAEAVELAKMPSRTELLGKFMMMLNSPLTSFAGMCSSPLSGFARALSQMADKGGFVKAEAPAAAAPAAVVEAAPAAETPATPPSDAQPSA
jgi:large subunit ribosomal protein L10